MTRYFLFTALLCAAVPAAAQAPISSEPPCLRQGYIYDFQPLAGNRSLIVTDLARKRYRLNFIGVCYNLQHHLSLGFKTHGIGTLSCVARGDAVILHDVVGPDQCIIKDIGYQTPALDLADAAAAAAAKQH